MTVEQEYPLCVLTFNREYNESLRRETPKCLAFSKPEQYWACVGYAKMHQFEISYDAFYDMYHVLNGHGRPCLDLVWLYGKQCTLDYMRRFSGDDIFIPDYAVFYPTTAADSPVQDDKPYKEHGTDKDMGVEEFLGI